MKKFTLLFTTLCVAVGLEAQITLTAADFTFNQNGGDTSYHYGFDKLQLSLPQFGADIFWDYSSLALDTNSYFFPYEAGTHPDFPTSNLRRKVQNTFFGETFSTYNYYTYDATGFYYDGQMIIGADIPLGDVTGNPADTLSIIGGGAVESAPTPYVTFPLNYGDASIQVSYSSSNFIANAPTFGLSNFTVEQRRKTILETEVKGWGKVALTNPQTQVVDTFEVLLVHQVESVIDSFYDGANNPLPATLLTPFGYTQGSTYPTDSDYRFFALGLDFYALYFYVNNGVIESATFNKSIFTDGTPVSTKSIQAAMVRHEVYPNPVQNNQFQLEIDKSNSENWQLDIYNVLGQSIHNELIINNISMIQLDNNLSSGQYFYTVRNENGETVANGKLIK